MAKQTLNIGGIIGALVVAYATYGILLRKKIGLLSIDTMQGLMNHWATHWHIIVVGLLPIYVAAVFFSAALGGLLLGSAIQRRLLRIFNHCHPAKYPPTGIDKNAVVDADICAGSGSGCHKKTKAQVKTATGSRTKTRNQDPFS